MYTYLIILGWLQNFKQSLGVSKSTIKGESGSVDITVVNEWKEGDMKEILNKYKDQDVYNADETALFWKCLPDKTLAFKGDKVEGRKAPKNRITLLVSANMDGSDKLPLLILG